MGSCTKGRRDEAPPHPRRGPDAPGVHYSRMDLSGRVIAITGATSGIGEATAVMAARAGAAGSLAGRREDRLNAIPGRVEGEGGRGLPGPTHAPDGGPPRNFRQQPYQPLGPL